MAETFIVPKQDLAELLRDPQVQGAIRSLSDHAWEAANLVLLLATAVIAGLTALYISRQVKDAREEAERERVRLKKNLAVGLHDRWTDGQSLEGVAVSRFAVMLTHEQCLILRSPGIEPLYLEVTDQSRFLTELVFCQRQDQFKVISLIRNNRICIEGLNVLYIRFQINARLNLLESILAAWALDIVDKETIKYSFSFLASNENSLNTYRTAARETDGDDPMPYIAKFVAELQGADQAPEPHIPWYKRR